MAKIWHVAKSGGDFKTIGQAVAKAKAGDTVLVHAGVYQERVLINKNSGTEAAPIKIMGAAGEKVVIDAAGQANAIRVAGDVHHIEISGFNIKGATQSGVSINSAVLSPKEGDPSYITIANNYIHHNGTPGQVTQGIITGGHHIAIKGNTIEANGQHNIYVRSDFTSISDNLLKNAASDGIRAEGSNNSFVHNTIVDNGKFGISIWVDAPFKAVNYDIRDNVIQNNAHTGVRVFADGNGGKPQNINIQNNHIETSNDTGGVYVHPGVVSVTVKGNDFLGVSKYQLYSDATSNNVSGNHIGGAGVIYVQGKNYTMDAFNKAQTVVTNTQKMESGDMDALVHSEANPAVAELHQMHELHISAYEQALLESYGAEQYFQFDHA